MKKEKVISTVDTYLREPKELMQIYHSFVNGILQMIEDGKIAKEEVEQYRCSNDFFKNLFNDIHA